MATSAYLISRAAIVTDVASVALAITCVRVFAISRAAARYLERLTSHRAALRILTELRAWFYAAVEPLAPAGLSRHRSGDLVARSVADVETLEAFYVRGVIPPVAAVLVAIATCALLAWFDLALAAVLLAFLLIAGVALPLLMRGLSASLSRRLVDARAEVQTRIVDEVQGLPELLVLDANGAHWQATLAAARTLRAAQARMGWLRGLGTALQAMCVSCAMLAVLAVAIPLVSGGDIDGVYIALLVLASAASFEAVQPLAPALQQLDASQEAGRRVFEIIDQPAAVQDPPSPQNAPATDGIEFRHVSFAYDGGARVLDDVCFRVARGEVLGITGPSGAGKSTIANLALRFWDYDAGEILIGAADIRARRADDVREQIAMMPQDVHLFNTTIRENILLARPDASDDEVVAACGVAMLADVIEALPDRYDTMIGENGVRLTGGERQRIGIARAVLKDAPIMILDEPTANLDAATERAVMEALRPVFRDRAVIVISHREVALAVRRAGPALVARTRGIIGMRRARVYGLIARRT